MKEKEILRRTARSFALTLGLLPRGLRSEASLAYLLARGTDTIADVARADADQRAGVLRAFRSSLERPVVDDYDTEAWASLCAEHAERQLLARMPELWSRMQSLEPSARRRMRTVIGRILEGQIFDLGRFHPGAPPLTGDEVERYTYLVAGSVGEFWTDLCRERLRRFSREPHDVMLARARRYGQALQLVNILRDRKMDEALGRVYVEASAVPYWMAAAREWLGEGGRYCAALHSGRLRYATLLPALLGLRTLALLEGHPGELITPRKVPRSELRRWMLRALTAWWSPRAVDRLMREAGA